MFSADGRLQIDRTKLSAKADELDHLIHKLGGLRDILRHAAECPAPSHMECRTFQRMLKLASGPCTQTQDIAAEAMTRLLVRKHLARTE